ncbi:MAG: hypothetical protein LUQ68_08375 [Methylococcaceae bacterium]|nr:hypothetical protein [Methylococcaceae bacterium]OYV22073.1 MAG: hypothetical protein CG442_1560 [Methylococcaceae bacterium NSO1]
MKSVETEFNEGSMQSYQNQKADKKLLTITPSGENPIIISKRNLGWLATKKRTALDM